MTMEIVTKNSEQVLVNMLEHIQNNSSGWLSLHINIAPLHQQMLNQEGLSNEVLTKIRKISMQVAQKLYESGLSTVDGKIMVFEDSDVLALVSKQADSLKTVLEALRSEFTKSDMIHLLVIEEMEEKLGKFLSLSEEKVRTADDYLMKKRAIEIGENLKILRESDPEVTEAVQKKRHMRASGCILIIEDDVMIRGLLATMLQGTHPIIQAKNAEKGIIAYIDQAPNIVFLDIHMPGMDGHDTLKHLMRIDPHAYVVMLSGDSSAENVIATQTQGAAGFVRKPFTKEKLLEYVKKCPSLQPKALANNLGWFQMKRDPRN
jgi:CheY-like chemotaxis protein